MMPSLRVLALLLLAASSARAQSTEIHRSWNQPVEPYRIVGPLYYVGARDIAAFLLATPEGHVLINSCPTWTIDLTDSGHNYQAVIVCSMTINPGVRLVGNPRYPAIAEDYARTFRILEGLRGEVFLGAHASLYDASGKAQRLRAGERPNPFVDPAGYRRAVEEARGRFEEQLAREKAEAAVAPPAAGRVLTDVPSPADPQGRYVLYLHGRILEEQGRQAVSPDFGRYEYDAVLRALADRGFTVIAEVRPRGTGPEYAHRVAAQLRRLLEAGAGPSSP